MPTSNVEIVNSALVKLGGNTIIDFTDGTKEANLATLRFEYCLDTVMRAHSWNFAKTRVILAPDATAPAFQYSYKFQLPVDCLRVLNIYPIELDIDMKIEGRYILCDETELDLLYIKKVTDPTQIDFLCAEAIALFFAFDISYSLTQDFNIQSRMWNLYQEALKVAKSVNGKEQPAQELQADDWLQSRISNDILNRANR